ncbi:phage tail protein [Pseudoalteromonas sp. JBTF-M23]|uniref:Phage tail protein n=1 Tax=Pseudoalteromonas caenipelagi TaxID=2726988 RepID=A0A849VNF3_9GAMM|nr:phage tail protein [Pseudoalteromonas caenipelagi]NOU53087.1 phage tail protein [Pseudoalteromonas caenipelagi]
MTSDVMIALGDYRFSVHSAAYSEFRRVSEYRWRSQERLSRTPAMQYIGPGYDEVTMTGTIYPHFNGGLFQVEAMRAEAVKGKPLLLVDGLGYVRGNYVITRIEETQTDIRVAGVAEKIEFNITLKYYGDDNAI